MHSKHVASVYGASTKETLSLSIGSGAQQTCGKCLQNEHQGTFRSHWKERVDKQKWKWRGNPQNKMSMSHLIFLPTDNTLLLLLLHLKKGLLLFIIKSESFQVLYPEILEMGRPLSSMLTNLSPELIFLKTNKEKQSSIFSVFTYQLHLGNGWEDVL